MDISPITLVGHFVRLEPMTLAHESALIAAAADGELWNTDVTIIPRAEGMRDYIQYALDGLAQGNQLPFVIRYAGVSPASSSIKAFALQTKSPRRDNHAGGFVRNTNC
jgi:hypothetical protein